ncbi:hypothetical protein FOZ60_008935 [Perkinsus olseni]|uniref:Polycystin cation channel PKD1/PKD2 domain-containing protein n=1 Tax=Perkinsus olseni TaxID=32597 RepID=A0A7J6PF96_PEROL|nr:hypothetical protein FOZ60_008935 [Perkinsus olseni]
MQPSPFSSEVAGNALWSFATANGNRRVLGTRLVVLLCFLILIALSIYLTTPTAAKVGAITRPLTEAGGFSLGMEDRQPLTSWDPVLTSLQGVSDLTSLYGLQTHEDPDAVTEGFQYTKFTLSPPTLLEESTAPGKKRCSAEMRRVYIGLARQAGLSQSEAEKFTLVPQVLVGLLTGGHGSESSVVSVLRFEWKRASKMFPTGCGTVSLWIAGAHSARGNRLLLHREVKEVIRRKDILVFRQPDDKLSYPRLRRLEGHHRLCDGLRRAHFYRFTSSAERHAQLVTNVIDAQPSTSETHARLLDLRDSLRRETYSASFGMLLMWVSRLCSTSSMRQPEGITFATIFVFMSFIGHYAAGEDFEHFRTVWSTLVLQFEILWSGEWDIPNWSSHPALSLYLVPFVVVIFIALLNFFVAIVVEAYLAVRRTVFTADYTQSFIQDYMAVLDSLLTSASHRQLR